jgi:hypothetical protein
MYLSGRRRKVAARDDGGGGGVLSNVLISGVYVNLHVELRNGRNEQMVLRRYGMSTVVPTTDAQPIRALASS